MITFNIDLKFFFRLIIVFILMTVIGTISHECGHWLAARLMGFHAWINYMSTGLSGNDHEMSEHQGTWFLLGGPLQTMLTGTIGLVCLFFAHKRNKELTTGKWALIFLSLSWLRQSANFICWLGYWLITGKFPNSGDEIRLSNDLNISEWILTSCTALIGFIVLAIVIFKFIPLAKRFTFILGGLIGGVSGYLLWLVYFGKYILP